jgi:hypothetical protein
VAASAKCTGRLSGERGAAGPAPASTGPGHAYVALAIVRCRAGARSKQSCAAAHTDARYWANPQARCDAKPPDRDDRYVANAIVRREAAGRRKRSCGPRQPDARDWAKARASNEGGADKSGRLLSGRAGAACATEFSTSARESPGACVRSGRSRRSDAWRSRRGRRDARHRKGAVRRHGSAIAATRLRRTNSERLVRAAGVLGRDLRQRPVQHRHMIIGGVGAGVPGAQQPAERLARLIQVDRHG